jgi:hypothetical protein
LTWDRARYFLCVGNGCFFWEEPLIYIPDKVAAFAAAHNTSPVVAYAIFEMTPDAVEEERVWARPTHVEVRTILRRAWQLVARDQEAIYWNGCAYSRISQY